ncbi:MAG: DUF3575 domain-containing protein [Bacteroidales bacterium]|nr:DUF3575 domain-containing protein [Bacteroidales bacterium]
MKKRFLSIILTLLCCGNAMAQEFDKTLTLYFRNGSAEYDRNFSSNRENEEEFFRWIETMQQIPGVDIIGIETEGSASPEGSATFNKRLAEMRRISFRNEIRRNLDFPEYKIAFSPTGDGMAQLRELILNDTEIFDKARVLQIIGQGGPQMIDRLKAIDGGLTYRYMEEYLFPELRTYRMTVKLDFSDHIAPVELPEDEDVISGLEYYEDGLDFVRFIWPQEVPFLKVERHKGHKYVVALDETPKKYLRKIRRGASDTDKYQNTPINAQTHPEKYGYASAEPQKTGKKSRPLPEKRQDRPKVTYNEDDRNMSIKTNVAGLALGVANLGFEFDVSDNISLNFPFYYSGWQLYSETFRFKGLVAQPEVRFHIPKTGGLYFGVHAGIAWYNMALGGNWRYQNCGWAKPTVGAGLNAGYRVPLGKRSGWGLEIGIGGGAYYAVHDRFYNEHNGPYAVREARKFYYGIDNVSLSLTYSFSMRKGGRR